jgi:mRNA interferase RelE/StbE
MKVLLTVAAQRDVAELPVVIRARLDGVFQRLERWPEVSGAKPLSGKLVGHYRIRSGDYRVLFRVEGDRVLVTRVRHRKDVYDG